MYGGNLVTVQLGQLGLLTDVPAGEVPRGALIRANDISYETGKLTKAPGSLRYNTSPLSAGIVGLADWHPDEVIQRMFAATSDGKIYRDFGDLTFSGGVPVATGLGALTPKCFFVTGGNETAGRAKKLFFFSGTAQVRVLSGDGVLFSVISAPAVDWTSPNFPTIALVHRNRLWAFSKQIAYASDTGDHENFQTNFLLQNIFPGEGGNILGAFVFKGRLFAFKQGGFVYYLDDSSLDSADWDWKKTASNFGLASPHGIVEVGNDMIAVNGSGSPTSYSAVNNFGDIESGDVLRLLQIEQYFRENVSFNGLDFLHSMYYEAKKMLFITYRTKYQLTNDTLLMIDFNRERPRPAFWPKDHAECLILREDINKILRPIYGSADGYVYLMDREDRLVGGSAYTGEFKTGHMDFRFLDDRIANKNKIFDNLAVEFTPTGNWNIEVDVYIDGTFSETITFNQDVRDDGLDDFTLDLDPLGREENQTIQKPLHGSGRRIAFHVKQSGSNENFELASLTVGFRLSSDQATRI